MSFNTWLAFLAGVIIICGSPGPNMLQVMSSSVRHGFKRSVFTMMGCFVPVFLMIAASVIGIGTFIELFPAMYDGLRYAGAVYLIYLGIQAWRAKGQHSIQAETGIMPAPTSKNLFWRGFLVGASNPKAMLFATAFFPQFVDPHAPQLLQFAILLATFSVAEVSWYMIYALCGSRLTTAMAKPHIQRRFDRCTGSLFICFGAAMAAK